MWGVASDHTIWTHVYGVVTVPSIPPAPIVEPPQPELPEDIVQPLTDVEGRLVRLDIGYDTFKVFGVNENNVIYYRKGVTQETPFGTDWFALPRGRATEVTVCDHTGNTWVMGTD